MSDKNNLNNYTNSEHKITDDFIDEYCEKLVNYAVE